jgi:Transposase family tnp2
LLSDAETERLCDKACDDAMAAIGDPPEGDMKNIFHVEFMKKFKGLTSGRLFIDRGDKVRLAFAIHTDFFNPNGVRKWGNHDSIGIISLINLNLPENIRLQPDNLFPAGIIPGPSEPEKEEISHYLRPIIDESVVAWERGIYISKTASCPKGRDVEVAIVISVNDLPAARKVSGTAGVGSHFYCTVCTCTGHETMYNSNFNTWKARDITEMCLQAEAWWDAQTSQERDDIFDKYGVRWSEFWRLPYWDPSQMLVIDSMHCILEGIVHYHCRRVLELDADRARASVPKVPAFSYPWIQYSMEVPVDYRVKHDREEKQIIELHHVLVLPFNSGPESFTEEELRAKLMSKNISPLKFVCYFLKLPMEVLSEQGCLVPAKSKKHFSDLLINWVSCTLELHLKILIYFSSIIPSLSSQVSCIPRSPLLPPSNTSNK